MATERKWASSSTRRGGMTVLGKVAVPKPINLPSQKLENHGVDPNVEIVPKGTLSWGNRSGSPAPNPWGSSLLSLNTDNGRPSSGGSGTRPSTGGSDKAYESTTNVWGSNSRPSSASGSLTSNQASGTTLRPRSADTRPGSSHLSRFAEPSTENSGSWAAAGSGDNVAHLKDDKFSLTSGDFPTLGSEKENLPKNAHTSPQGGDGVDIAVINIGNLNHGRRDNRLCEDTGRPNMENRLGDAIQQNPNMHGSPQHLPPWHGAPAGVWYRGPTGAPAYVPPGGPPYGPPGALPYGPSGGPPYGPLNIPPYGPLIGPGGFPVEHPYYHPPMPAPSLGGSQPVPHAAGPRGGHQNNGEIYRPSNLDGHFHPGMPMRPGFFPGPVPYDGYYPPPVGYCGPNGRDIPYLGPQGGPSAYDRHSTHNALEHANSQSAYGKHGPHEKPAGPEQGISGHRHNPHEQYKVLLKQQGEGHEWGDSTASYNSQFGKGYLGRPSSHEKGLGAESNNDEKTDSRRTSHDGGPLLGSHNHGGSQFDGRVRLTDEERNTKRVTLETNIPDKVSSSEVVLAAKDSGLIKKIEGLNAKTRGIDGKQDLTLNFNRDEGKSRSHKVPNAPHFNNESITHKKSHCGGIINPPDSHHSEAIDDSNSSRKFSNSGPQKRTDYQGKGKPDFIDYEGHKNAHNGHFSTMVSSSKSKPLNLKVQDHCLNMVVGKPEFPMEGKDIVPNSESVSDPIDIEAQRAKKKEIAMQRAIQLQREEEERIKEQKAKAQAKLEELNRRTKLMECSVEKGKPETEKADFVAENAEKISSVVDIDGKQVEVQSAQLRGADAVLKSDTIVIGTRTLDPQQLIPKDDVRGCVTFPRQSPVEQMGGYHKIDARGEPPHYGGKNNTLKSKNKGFKEKQNSQDEIVASEMIVKAEGESFRYGNVVGEEVSKKVDVLSESEVHHRTKSDKSGKNEHKVEETSSSVVRQSVAPNISDIMKAQVVGIKPQPPNLGEANQGQPPVFSSEWTSSTESHASQLKEESQSRISNHARHQGSRKQSRNQQGNRIVDKTHGSDTVVWAPVKQQIKEVIKDSSLKVVIDEAGDHIGNNDHAHSNTKNRRAEIERYVPKPVAQELAQQVGAQQPVSAGTNLTGSATIRAEHAVENENVDINKQERAPKAWHQRDSAEASHRKGKGPKHNPFNSTVVSKEIHIPDSCETREKKLSDGWNSAEGLNVNAYEAPEASVPNSKGQASLNRGKPQYNKSIRKNGTYDHGRDHRKGQTGKDLGIGHCQSTIANSDELDRTVSHKEHHHEGGRPAAHWQSTPHDSSADNRRVRVRGVRQSSGQESTRFVKKEPAPCEDRFQPKNVEMTDKDGPQALAKTDPGSVTITGPQHDKRERKTAAPLIGSYLSNPNPRARVEQLHPVEHQHERPHSSSGVRKNDNQNNRNVIGPESQREWNSFEKDGRHHIQTSGRYRPRQGNSHYEYKPKGQGHTANADGGNS